MIQKLRPEERNVPSFYDIKNFTSTSEVLQPEDLTNYLNEYFSEMTKIALNLGILINI